MSINEFLIILYNRVSLFLVKFIKLFNISWDNFVLLTISFFVILGIFTLF